MLFSGLWTDKGRTVGWGARLHMEGAAGRLDREWNLVTVNYSFAAIGRDGQEQLREVTKQFSAAEMAGRTTLFT